MGRNILPVEHYETKLFTKYGRKYKIYPIEQWNGIKTECRIYCAIHKTYRVINLKNIFNGVNSMTPCRLCYLRKNCE